MVPLVDQKLVPVRLVEEALVMVPVVEKKVGAVRMEVEALTKLVWPLTVSAPPRYVLPVEWTEKREPGVVVPIPTFPLPSIVNLAFVPTAVEEAILNLLMSAVSTPIAQPELVELVLKFKDGVVLPAIVKRLSGVAVPMPTFPV